MYTGGNPYAMVLNLPSELYMTTSPQPTALKIMVIDDSSTIRRSAEIFLGQAGYQVLLAEDGFDALAKINDHHPALVF